MSEPFLSEIMMVGFNFAPKGWSFCDGQLLPINQNQSLYSLLGTTYGGDGRSTFGLPEMRGRAPLHFNGQSGSHPMGQKAGSENETLTAAQMKQHTHGLEATNDATTSDEPGGNVFSKTSGDLVYHGLTSNQNMAAGAITHTGGGQQHNNMQPYLAINFCICLKGLFPSRN